MVKHAIENAIDDQGCISLSKLFSGKSEEELYPKFFNQIIKLINFLKENKSFKFDVRNKESVRKELNDQEPSNMKKPEFTIDSDFKV